MVGQMEGGSGSVSDPKEIKEGVQINFTDPSDDDLEEDEDEQEDEVYEVLEDKEEKGSCEQASWKQLGLFFLGAKQAAQCKAAESGVGPSDVGPPGNKDNLELSKVSDCASSKGKDSPQMHKEVEAPQFGLKKCNKEESGETSHDKMSPKSLQLDSTASIEMSECKMSDVVPCKPRLAKRTGTFNPSPTRTTKIRVARACSKSNEEDEDSPNTAASVEPLKVPPLKLNLSRASFAPSYKLSKSDSGLVTCCQTKKKKDTKLKCCQCLKLSHATCQNLTKSQVEDILSGSRQFSCTDCLLESVVCSRNKTQDSSYCSSVWRNSEESGLRNLQLCSETGFVGCRLLLNKAHLDSRLKRQCEDKERRYSEVMQILSQVERKEEFFWSSEIRPKSPQEQEISAMAYNESPSGEQMLCKVDSQETESPRKLQTARRKKFKPKENVDKVSSSKGSVEVKEEQLDSKELKAEEPELETKCALKRESLTPSLNLLIENSPTKECPRLSECETSMLQTAWAAKEPRGNHVKVKQEPIDDDVCDEQSSNKKAKKLASVVTKPRKQSQNVKVKVEASETVNLKDPSEEYRRKAFCRIRDKICDCRGFEKPSDHSQLKNFLLKIEREIFRFSLRSGIGDNRSLHDRYESKLIEVCNRLADADLVKSTFKGKLKIINLVRKCENNVGSCKKAKISKDVPDDPGKLFDTSLSEQKVCKVVKKEVPVKIESYGSQKSTTNEYHPTTSSAPVDLNMAWKSQIVHEQSVYEVAAFTLDQALDVSHEVPEKLYLSKLHPMSEFWQIVESLSRNAFLNKQLTSFQLKAVGKLTEYSLFTQKLQHRQLFASVRSSSGKRTIYVVPITKHDTKKPLVNGFSIDASLAKSEICLVSFLVLNSAIKSASDGSAPECSSASTLETDSVLDAIASEIDKNKEMEAVASLSYPNVNPPPLNSADKKPVVPKRLSNSSDNEFNFDCFPELTEDDDADLPPDVVFEPPVSVSPDEVERAPVGEGSPDEDPRILPYFSPVNENGKSCDQFMPLQCKIPGLSSDNKVSDPNQGVGIVLEKPPSLDSLSPKPASKAKQDFEELPKDIPIDLDPSAIVPMDPRYAGKLYLEPVARSELELLAVEWKPGWFSAQKDSLPEIRESQMCPVNTSSETEDMCLDSSEDSNHFEFSDEADHFGESISHSGSEQSFYSLVEHRRAFEPGPEHIHNQWTPGSSGNYPMRVPLPLETPRVAQNRFFAPRGHPVHYVSPTGVIPPRPRRIGVRVYRRPTAPMGHPVPVSRLRSLSPRFTNTSARPLNAANNVDFHLQVAGPRPLLPPPPHPIMTHQGLLPNPTAAVQPRLTHRTHPSDSQPSFDEGCDAFGDRNLDVRSQRTAMYPTLSFDPVAPNNEFRLQQNCSQFQLHSNDIDSFAGQNLVNAKCRVLTRMEQHAPNDHSAHGKFESAPQSAKQHINQRVNWNSKPDNFRGKNSHFNGRGGRRRNDSRSDSFDHKSGFVDNAKKRFDDRQTVCNNNRIDQRWNGQQANNRSSDWDHSRGGCASDKKRAWKELSPGSDNEDRLVDSFRHNVRNQNLPCQLDDSGSSMHSRDDQTYDDLLTSSETRRGSSCLSSKRRSRSPDKRRRTREVSEDSRHSTGSRTSRNDESMPEVSMRIGSKGFVALPSKSVVKKEFEDELFVCAKKKKKTFKEESVSNIKMFHKSEDAKKVGCSELSSKDSSGALDLEEGECSD